MPAIMVRHKERKSRKRKLGQMSVGQARPHTVLCIIVHVYWARCIGPVLKSFVYENLVSESISITLWNTIDYYHEMLNSGNQTFRH